MSELSAKMKSPIDIIEADHTFQNQVCDMLERIADDLPDQVDKNLCLTAIHALTVDMPIHHADEENGLFPLLEQRALPEDNLVEIVGNLCMEHATDESFAEELLDSLRMLAEGQKPLNPNMLGYMLRGFFEGYRRHLVWENTIVLPLARRLLIDEDLKKLKECMADHRKTVINQDLPGKGQTSTSC